MSRRRESRRRRLPWRGSYRRRLAGRHPEIKVSWNLLHGHVFVNLLKLSVGPSNFTHLEVMCIHSNVTVVILGNSD